MGSFFTEVRETLLPAPDARHGPLPPLLVGLTLVTGLVDAFSYLLLGHVFVANMTGNVVFLAFALAGAAGFSIAASVVALVSFWCGALVGGRVGARLGQHRGRLLTTGVTLQGFFFAAALVLAAVSGNPVAGGYRYPLIIVLGVAMGLQNAVARRLAVPDLTTTVLTLTITGVAADSTMAGGHGSATGRRFTSVAAMFLGALIGAQLVLHVAIALPLAAAVAVVCGVAVTSHVRGAADVPWVHP